MKASELIKELQELIEKHGDHEVFSTADYEIVSGAAYSEKTMVHPYGEEPFEIPTFDMCW
jgi:hypothetical protein